ncbi:MAG: glycosyltransferase [Calditrichaeota bacterium]|nr:MAG: glycosyltransferase [Calditrichota bacterium]
MILLLWPLLVLMSVILLVTLVNVLSAPLVKNGPSVQEYPLVSVLIPARNEGENIQTCLETLMQQSLSSLEIIVLDDCSIDNTSDVVRSVMIHDCRIRLIQGEKLPVGWTGKNWACFQLSRMAQGDYYIFTDADNYFSSNAVEKTIGWMKRLNLSLFSAFPQQITLTLGEKLIVPIFESFVYSLLPLWLTYFSKFSSIAAANGQWIAFTREGYRRIGGHEAVRNQIVEDTELARLGKRRGEKVLTAAGKDAVMARMYKSWRQVYWGFSKNAFGLMGYKAVPFFIFICLLIALYIMPYFLLLIPSTLSWSLIMILAGMSIRLLMALKYGHPLWISTFLNPLSIIAVIWIGLNSFRHYLSGSIVWKDRRINFE